MDSSPPVMRKAVIDGAGSETALCMCVLSATPSNVCATYGGLENDPAPLVQQAVYDPVQHPSVLQRRLLPRHAALLPHVLCRLVPCTFTPSAATQAFCRLVLSDSFFLPPSAAPPDPPAEPEVGPEPPSLELLLEGAMAAAEGTGFGGGAAAGLGDGSGLGAGGLGAAAF